MKLNQKGFSFVEVLIVIVIVGLLGAAGWFVYNKQNKDEAQKTDTNSSNQVLEDSQETSSPAIQQMHVPEGWIKYDSHQHFSFLYPQEWSSDIEVKEFPLDKVFELRYGGDLKLNEDFDGWVYATSRNGFTIGENSESKPSGYNSSLRIWEFGFGDAGFGSGTPTFIANNKIYQIETGSFCPEKSSDCMLYDDYEVALNKLVSSIKLK